MRTERQILEKDGSIRETSQAVWTFDRLSSDFKVTDVDEYSLDSLKNEEKLGTPH